MAVIHRDAAKGDGLLWEVLGRQPHDQAVLNLAPAETAYAMHGDVNLDAIIKWLSTQLSQHAPDQAVQLLPMLQDPNVKGLIDSYGGEIGFYLTLDPDKKIVVPVNGPPMVPPAIEGFVPPGNPDVIDTIELPPVPDAPVNPGPDNPEGGLPPLECDEPPVDVVPVPQDDGPDPACPIAYTDECEFSVRRTVTHRRTCTDTHVPTQGMMPNRRELWPGASYLLLFVY